ncbi:MAG: CPBP family intramembrane metalloprotease [Chromatiales bacterium]|jgi:membrane protease YdiL (CAAX protease family)|nr:CPBP family intramembrane metalloprotease [Chromatiales bacterium]
MGNRILKFGLMAYAWTWVTTLPLLLSNRGIVDWQVPGEWEGLGALGPLVAALVMLGAEGPEARRRFWQSLTRWRGLPRAGVWLALVTPFVFLAVALAVQMARGGLPGWAELSTGRLGTLRSVVDLFIIGSLVQGLGEETGWRGYLQPRLRTRLAPFAFTFALFPIWLFWHMPFFLGRPEFGIAQFAGFSLGILSAGFFLTLIVELTGSVLLAVLFHALLNATRNVALAVSTPAFLAYGLAVTVGAVALAVYLFRRGREPGVPAPLGLPAGAATT